MTAAGAGRAPIYKRARKLRKLLLRMGYLLWDRLRAPLYRLLRSSRLPALQRPGQGRSQIELVPVQPDVVLVTCWKDFDIGTGPALYLVVHGVEVLRCDCFGAPGGHYHINPRSGTGLFRGNQDRLYFPEPERAGQVARAVFEIRRNSDYFLQHSTDPRIRRLRLDGTALAGAVDRAEAILQQLLQDHGGRVSAE